MRADVARLTRRRFLPNLVKIPLLTRLMILLTWLAWITSSGLVRWTSYLGIGYLWMGMVTFMHDATHNRLFRTRVANLVFGIVCMLPLMAPSERAVARPRKTGSVTGRAREKTRLGGGAAACVRIASREQRLAAVGAGYV